MKRYNEVMKYAIKVLYLGLQATFTWHTLKAGTYTHICPCTHIHTTHAHMQTHIRTHMHVHIHIYTYGTHAL